MKKLGLFLLMAMLSVAACFPAFAGEWKQYDNKWWYDNGDSTYAKDGWNWIDGKCYYFGTDGYCLINTTTPDGYQVDASGAWTVNGVVQTKIDESAWFIPPSEYRFYAQKDAFTMFTHTSKESLIWAYDLELDYDIADINANVYDYIDVIMDHVMSGSIGEYSAKTHSELNSGTWIRYDYAEDNLLNTSGTVSAYARLSGRKFGLVVFIGDNAGTDTDAIMNASVR
jgi:FOG: Glucan-binding domain (YG repeat)